MITLPTASWAHTVFDVLAWAGAAATGTAVYRWRLREAAQRLASATGPFYFLSLAAGGVLGAWLSGSLNTLRAGVPTLSHSVAGALAGAIVAVELYKRVAGIRGSTGIGFVAPFCVGIVIGRFGCLFAGLPDFTYGTPTKLSWAVNLGDGVGRHPVQLYESLAMLIFLLLFLRGLARRDPWVLRRGFYWMAAWYGAQRFAWEFLKPYPPLVGPFNLFHILCGGLVIYGCGYAVADIARERGEEGHLAIPVFR